ncbi:type I-E CRISPR-associated protein Cas5/CasD [uncultured Tessaracoccus sp.]|uniref:type I-E CRISPR-associated protein Cas5/CasD n=1 Tax=uncultured Tessaracoccus sp. TaxID=905023 RepID=UPI0025D4B750|nr:type I-E CRISPR-associated protein Cas5/CasD [uncultured Tessaracoccus sp.]
MSVLVLRLAGPLQSWGSQSRFTRRLSEPAPTKSGVLGLLAAAMGRRRSDPIEDLLSLSLAVRIDQGGRLLRDFQTAIHPVSGKAMPLTHRFYRADAVFSAFVAGPREVLEGLDEALRDPKYPLYLGRRSCVPTGRISLGVHDEEISDAVAELEWQASAMERRRHRARASVRLAVQADQEVFPELATRRELQDVPVSFNLERRRYRTRVVIDTYVDIPTGFEPGSADSDAVLAHDPIALLRGI